MIPGSLETYSAVCRTSTKPALDFDSVRNVDARKAARPTHISPTKLTVLRQVLHTLSIWWTRAAERQRLSMLSDHLLRDIGLNRVDVYREVSKPFWCE